MPIEQRHALVVIGGSAGALEAVRKVLSGLPSDLHAAVMVVLHAPANGGSALPRILERTTPLRVVSVREPAPLEPGVVYLPASDHHLLVKGTGVEAVHGPKENGFRPAIDPLFRTAAITFGPRVLGVILSGARDDGVHGLKIIKREGGMAIVQNPEEALVPSMPLAALKIVEVDHVLAAADIAGAIRAAAPSAPIPGGRIVSDRQVKDVVEENARGAAMHLPDAAPVPFTCPECGGSLWEIGHDPVRYRCHVGHGFTGDTLLDEQGGRLDAALWFALRALREHAALQRRMAQRAREGQLLTLAEGYETRARDAEKHAVIIESVLARSDSLGTAEDTSIEQT